MTDADHTCRVTLHMAASLDGFVARPDGSVDWMETADEHPGGAALDGPEVSALMASIDGYLMGSRTYETALAFEDRGLGWPYGDTPTTVLTTRDLPRTRDSVRFLAGDLPGLMERLRGEHRDLWVVGGPELCGALLRQGLADVLRLTLLPVVIGEGLPFFRQGPGDRPLHLVDSTAYANGMVELVHACRSAPGGTPDG